MKTIVKKIIGKNGAEDVFEFFVIEIVKDIQGNEVSLPKFVGKFAQKQLENIIIELQTKLDLIINYKED